MMMIIAAAAEMMRRDEDDGGGSVCGDVMKATIAYAGDKKKVTPKPHCRDPRTKNK